MEPNETNKTNDFREKDFTPSFDFSEKVNVEGRERKIELAASGLYVFDKKEKFDKPRTSCSECGMVSDPQTSDHKFDCSRARGGHWVGVTHPLSTGKVLVPLTARGGFKRIKVRSLAAKLALTRKTK